MLGQGAAPEGPALDEQAHRHAARARRIWLQGAIVALVTTGSVVGRTQFHSPPRFDGAGYAVLAQALRTGHGYREIDNPDWPLHAHYPPGYPAALAALWSLTGPSAASAHAFSVVCTVLAALAGWAWLRTLYPGRIALVLALAVAINWSWGRAGGSIQSEPLFLLLSLLTLRLTIWASRGPWQRAFGLGLLLGASILTRHVGVALAAAVCCELWLRHRFRSVLIAGLVATACVAPWVRWVALVRHNTQVALLAKGIVAERLGHNVLFYLRRIPDALAGPYIEVATVFGPSPVVAMAATVLAALVAGMIVGGWIIATGNRRRLAALVGLTTLALLLVWPFTEAGRFLIPLVPMLLVGAVEGLMPILRMVRLRRPRRWAAWLLLVASLPYSAYSLLSDRTGAQERLQAPFDAACGWIARHGRLGPILTRQPGEAFWLTGRAAVAPVGDAGDIARQIDRYHVAYILVESDRYMNAPVNPLRTLVAQQGERFVRVFPEAADAGPVSVYEVRAADPQR